MKICLGVTGSIAAYRSPDFAKELVKRGHEVQVILTDAARELVSARALETFTGRTPWSNDPYAHDHTGTDHISLARWADVIVVYGATADFLARYAQGMAGDFLGLQLLATRSPVIVAPAMNPDMWAHPAVQSNVARIAGFGATMVGPIGGIVACGESGLGHIAEISEIVAAVEGTARAGIAAGQDLKPSSDYLKNQRVLISAGPMRTSFDSVRFVQNRSSGRMGLELARAAQRAGAEVEVILGPVDPSIRQAFAGFPIFPYEGAAEYERALEQRFPECDVFLSAAAVLDFDVIARPGKIERSTLEQSENLSLPIRAVPDFVARMASRKRPGQKVIAFAAEAGTEAEILKRATTKMLKKGVDAIAANPVWPGLGPDAANNQLWVLKPGRSVINLGPAPKASLAAPLLAALLTES